MNSGQFRRSVLLLCFVIFCTFGLFISARSTNRRLLTCYADSNFSAYQIDTQLCTHVLVIGAATFANDSLSIALPTDEYIQSFTKLKESSPNLKILITFLPDNAKMSQLVLNETLTTNMLNDVVVFMQRNSLDGFDYDWEFPAWSGNAKPTDRLGFSNLLKATKNAFNGKFLLFVTVAAPYMIVDTAYDINALNQFADYVQIMNYDFRVYTEHFPFTGFNAPLYSQPFDISVLKRLNSYYSTLHWITEGLNVSKLIFGIPTYGRAYELSLPDVHGIYAPIIGISSKYGDLVPYETVCKLLINNATDVHTEWNENAASPFLYCGTTWISYENEDSVRRKARFAIDEIKSAGIMVFALHSDDYSGVCSSKRKSYPLIRVIKKELNRKKKSRKSKKKFV